MILNGEHHQEYVRGLATSYQNTGRTHIHILPIQKGKESEIAGEFLNQINQIHGYARQATMNQFRDMRKNGSDIEEGTITAALIQDPNATVNYHHFSRPDLKPEYQGKAMSAIAGSILRKTAGSALDIDFDNKEKDATKADRLNQLKSACSTFYRNSA